ncbi:MAG: HAMP domain-containing sensor histidine kinase [Cyclobacteriaceae bacterium]
MKKETQLYQKIQENSLADISSFHAMIHDIKSPLNQVEGLLRIVLNQNRDKDIKELINMALECNSRISGMVSDIMHAASCETNDCIDLSEIIHRLHYRLKAVEGFQNTDIILNDQDTCSFFTNRAILTSILQNLLENAIKYRNPEQVRNKVFINCNIECGKIYIEVKDNGMGIEPKLLPRIFQRSIKNGDNCGHGMGLYISRENAQKLGGSLTARSNEKSGTTFLLKLPVTRI